MCIYKIVDVTGNIISDLGGLTVTNYLGSILGFHIFGRYYRARLEQPMEL